MSTTTQITNGAAIRDARKDAFLAKHAATLKACSRRLAMDFDTPAVVIMNTCASELGINRKQLDALWSYEIALEEEEFDREWKDNQSEAMV